MDKAILKEAAVTLRSQRDLIAGQRQEIADLQEKLACAIYAEKILSDQLQYEDVPGDVVLKKLSEYKNKSKAQLGVLEQAVELSKLGSFLGQVSNETVTSDLDPLTAYLLNGD